MIKENDDLYMAIENAILDIFEAKIPLEDPYETTRLFVKSVNKELNDREVDVSISFNIKWEE